MIHNKKMKNYALKDEFFMFHFVQYGLCAMM